MNALVTGGNRGIGLELCRLLSEEYGCKVYMACRDKGKAEAAIADNRLKNVFSLEIDVSRESSIQKAAASFNDSLFLLINNAGAQLDWIPNKSHVKSLEADENLLLSIYRTNVFASVFMCKYFLPFMQKGGRVVNVSSGSGEFWDPNANLDFQIGYAPSKSALIMTTKKLAAAARELGVVVNACCPGWCQTAMGGEGAPTSARDGAMSVIQACFLDSSTPPSGGYYRYGTRIPVDVIPHDLIESSNKIHLEENKQNTKIFCKQRAILVKEKYMNIIKNLYKKYNTLRSLPKRINDLENAINTIRERERERERETCTINCHIFLPILQIKTI
ncbi:SDR family NAD(P)-dependent oxidoreductase, partial [uncultured Desulfovibrio sp.]|uniref:SDR family NAD(P)-dependent oxidoreductase n=1 Tax=uncultured Desulfovibrio sp. TaxID=167968 RepID=UPI00260A7BEE